MKILIMIRPDEKQGVGCGVVSWPWSWSHGLLESLAHELVQEIHAGVQIRGEQRLSSRHWQPLWRGLGKVGLGPGTMSRSEYLF